MYKRYTAGKDFSKTIEIVQNFNKNNVQCSISYLPIKKNDVSGVYHEVLEYYKLIDKIKQNKLDADVTLKVHQFGVYANQELCTKAITDIVKYAHNNNTFVWIDMEMKDTVDYTINLFQNIHKKYKNTGIALQAYLKRTEEDMKELLKNKVPIRLVKGFYSTGDFNKWSDVTKNYEHLMKYLLLHSKRPCIATHDLALIAKAKEIIKKHKLKHAELQMFKGVRDELAVQNALEGFNARVYVPYGHVYKFLFFGLPTFDLIHAIKRILGFKTIT